MSNEEELLDNSGVRLHPPLFFVGGFLLACGLNWIWRLPIWATGLPVQIAGGIAFIGCGAAIIAAGRRVLKGAGTNINPTKPTTAIVEGGPYRFSRNPLYLSLTMIFIGLTLIVNTWWGFILLVPMWLTMHFAVVLREERYLERKFDNDYRAYRARVRRYL